MDGAQVMHRGAGGQDALHDLTSFVKWHYLKESIATKCGDD